MSLIKIPTEVSSKRRVVAKVHHESHGMRSKVLSEMRNCQEGAGGEDQLLAGQSQAALKSRELKESLKLALRILAELRPEQLSFIFLSHGNGNSIEKEKEQKGEKGQ